MAHVVDYEEFTALKERLEQVEANYSLLKSLLIGQQWLNRAQTAAALKVSFKTLKRLTHPDYLVHRYDGKKPYYDIDSIRKYLAAQKIGSEEVDFRVIGASRM